jgi:hypothetical protein
MVRKGDPDRIENADVEVGASVKAKRLRFREKPETEVELHGELREPEGPGDLQTASGSERENLPEEVEPGVTYRDVRVRWRAAARLDEPRGSSGEGSERKPKQKQPKGRSRG